MRLRTRVRCLDTPRAETYTLPFARTRKFPTVWDAARERLKSEVVFNDGVCKSMPNHKAAEKRQRQNEKRRQINRSNRTRLRTEIKRLRAALEEGGGEDLQQVYAKTVSTIDKAVNKGVLHRNAASRYKSRLTARVNDAGAK